MAAKQYVQSQTLYLAGSGALIGATSIVLTSLTDIYGNVISAISAFGDKGYITLEPDTSNEEGATFTSVTVNANGTVTLGGVSTILAQAPYTETSGLIRSHSGGTKVVITDNVAFWATFANKNNNETITGIWSAPTGGTGAQIATNTDIANAVTGASGTATNLVAGTTKLSIAAVSSPSPIAVGDNDTRIPINAYATDSGTATAYAITLSTAPAAYVAGQLFFFKAAHTNTTTTPTLNVNSLGAKVMTKIGTNALAVGDIVVNALVQVQYDGTRFQILSVLGTPTMPQTSAAIFAVDSGTANSYAATLAPAITAYVAGLVLNVQITNASTGASTLNVNGLGTKTIKKLNGTTDITKGDLLSGSTYQFTYDGTNFVTEVPSQMTNGAVSYVLSSVAITTTTITTNFKPRIIRMWWTYIMAGSGGNQAATGAGTYNAATTLYGSTFIGNSAGSGGAITPTVSTDNGSIASGESNSNVGSFTGAIGNLTDTTFDLVNTQLAGGSVTIKLAWEATT